MEEEKESGAIDYEALVESDKNTIGLGTKVRLDLFFFFSFCLIFLIPVDSHLKESL